MALKLAIVACHPKRQRDVAMLSRIGEVRLSKIVSGDADASEQEQKTLAAVLTKLLKRPVHVHDLFSSEATAGAA